MNSRSSIPFIAASIAVLVMEFLLRNPDQWFIGTLAFIAVVGLSLVLVISGRYSMGAPMWATLATLVPAFGVLFLIDSAPLWQHVYVVIVGWALWYHLRFFVQDIASVSKPFRNIILPIMNMFFTAALMFGVGVFIHVPVFLSTLLFGILILLYPRCFRYVPQIQTSQTPLPLENVGGHQHVALWFDIGSGTCEWEQGSKRFKDASRFVRSQCTLSKGVILISAIQLSLVLQLLPTDFLVNAAVITIALFSIISLLMLAELGLTKASLIRRSLAMSAILIVAVFSAAQW